MRFGIISFAHMHAHSYARALNLIPDAELAGIADSDGFRGSQVAAQYGTSYVRNYTDLLEHDLNAVIVCSPNAEHPKHVCAAIQAGKHVLCEKPIATSLTDARKMIAAAEQKGVVLQTAFPVRHSNPVRRLKDVVAEGKIGEIFAVNATNHGTIPSGWFLDKELSGGGAVMDHTVHVVDLMRWILGSEVNRVYAEVDTLLHDVAIDDCGMLTMDFESGVIASLDPSWSRPKTFPTWGDVTMELIGTKGVISLDAFAQAGTVYATDPTKNFVRYNPWGNDMDREMIESFVAAVKGLPHTGASGSDGLKAMEVALGAYESARLGAPVTLPLGE